MKGGGTLCKPLLSEKRTATVFCGENLNPFLSAQTTSLFSVSCICLSQVGKLDDVHAIWRSSTPADYVMDFGIIFDTKFIFTIKSVGLRLHPCSTPFSWANFSESVEPRRTWNERSSRKSLKQFSVLQRIPRSARSRRMATLQRYY